MVLLDLKNSLFIREPQTLLDIERSESQSDGLGRGANISAELRRISLLQLLPRYELLKQHPAFSGVKCAAKRQVEGFDRKLTVMLLPVHLWLSPVAAFNNCHLPGQFTSSEQLKQAAAQWVCLFRKPYLCLSSAEIVDNSANFIFPGFNALKQMELPQGAI